jgi:hypothetical protein
MLEIKPNQSENKIFKNQAGLKVKLCITPTPFWEDILEAVDSS